MTAFPLLAAMDWDSICAIAATLISLGAVVRGELKSRVTESEQSAAWRASVDTSFEFIKRELAQLREDLRK